MARNTDIRLAINLPFHPKLRRLVKRFGPAAGWAWIVLLCHVGADRPDGCLGSLSDEEIAIAAEWDGDAEEFVSALISYRLLDRTEEGLAVHDWAEHNPWAAGANGRAEAARKAGKASAEARKRRNGATDGNEGSTDVERALNGRSTPSPSPSPTPYPTPTPTVERARVGEGSKDDGEDLIPPRRALAGMHAMQRDALLRAWEAAEGGILRGYVGASFDIDQFIRAHHAGREFAAVLEAIPRYAKAVAEGAAKHANLSTFVGGMYRRSWGPSAPAKALPHLDSARHYIAVKVAGQLAGFDPDDAGRYEAEARASPDLQAFEAQLRQQKGKTA